jgi:hypothetical protein
MFVSRYGRHLLRAYLGDGTVSHQQPNFWSLQIVNDHRYSGISAEILKAMALCFPVSTPRQWPSWRGSIRHSRSFAG